jgi:glyoxylase-like metal-dependent hydrolase (beta-lactamase superfamily II)
MNADDLVRGRHQVGDFELTICTDGTYLLDGGAMFGVVPKPLWQKRIAPDSENRIRLGLNTAIVRTGQHTVLIETGIGNKQSAKMKEIQGNQELLPASLAAAGIRPEEIDVVINTHLHFDHCGWNTTLHPDGTVTPTFPNARYFAHAGEVIHGHLQLDRDKVSYLSANYDPLIATGQMVLLDPHNEGGFAEIPAIIAGLSHGGPQPHVQTTCEIVPGVWVECFPGHTAQMMAVHIASNGQHACYAGDLLPTTHHLDPTWVMAYDLDPVRTIAERKRFYEKAIPENWQVIFTHDHEVPVGRVTRNEKGKPVIAESIA